MGQYHNVYNIDKKEFVHGHGLDIGAKLLEQVGCKSTATGLWLLLANSNGRGGGDAPNHPLIGRWAGDRIVVQGDYAEPDDPAYLHEEDREEFVDISAQVKDLLDRTFREDV